MPAALCAPGFAGSALAPPGREAAVASGSSDKKIQEYDKRKIIEMAGTVVAVVIAAAFIWLMLPAPGFIVDEASTVPLAGHQDALC